MGFLFKSDKRLASFDGTKWTTYSKEQLQVKDISVIAVAEKNGTLYFGGSQGVFTYDGKKWAILKMPSDNIVVRALDVSTTGAVAVGHNSGLLIYKDNAWTIFTEENSELRLGTVRAVKYDEVGRLYVGYGGGMGDGGFSILNNGKWQHFNKGNSKVPDHMVRDIEFLSGTVMMATNNGLIKIIGNDIEPIFLREGMFKNVVLDIAVEKNIVWVATNFGLIKLEK